MIGIISAIAIMLQQIYSMDELRSKEISYFDGDSRVYLVVDRGRYSIGSLAISGGGGYLMPQFGDSIKNCSSKEFRCLDIGIIKLALPSKGVSRHPKFHFNGYAHSAKKSGNDYLVVANCVNRNSCISSASTVSLVSKYELKFDGHGNLIDAKIYFNSDSSENYPYRYIYLKSITRDRIKI